VTGFFNGDNYISGLWVVPNYAPSVANVYNNILWATSAQAIRPEAKEPLSVQR